MSILILILARLFFGCTYDMPDEHLARADSMYVRSLHWTALARYRITPALFWKNRKLPNTDYYDTVIVDPATIDTLVKLCREMRELDTTCVSDVRLSCLLFQKDGRIDTLSFGRFGVLTINSRCYSWYPDVLEYVTRFLPEDHRALIYRQDFNDLPMKQ